MNTSNKLRLLATVALIPALCLIPGKANAFDLVSETLTNDPNLTPIVVDTLQSGDFKLVNSHSHLKLGDGVDEGTRWTFDFSPVATSIDILESAILDLTLKNSNNLITNDSMGIYGLGGSHLDKINTVSGASLLSQLAPGQAKAVQLDLLDFEHDNLTADKVADFFNSNNGAIPMYYGDDSVISSAKLTLRTRKAVPEPSAGAGLLLLGAIGAGSILKRQRQEKALEDNLG